MIKIQGKPFFYKKWYEGGVEIISDILNANGTFLDFEQFCRKYPNIKTNFLIFQGLIHAIPNEWKQKFAQLNRRGIQQGYNPKYWIEIIHETKALSKMFYMKFLPKIPKVENSFQQRWMEILESILMTSICKTVLYRFINVLYHQM